MSFTSDLDGAQAKVYILTGEYLGQLVMCCGRSLILNKKFTSLPCLFRTSYSDPFHLQV